MVRCCHELRVQILPIGIALIAIWVLQQNEWSDSSSRDDKIAIVDQPAMKLISRTSSKNVSFCPWVVPPMEVSVYTSSRQTVPQNICIVILCFDKQEHAVCQSRSGYLAPKLKGIENMTRKY